LPKKNKISATPITNNPSRKKANGINNPAGDEAMGSLKYLIQNLQK
jgi:hypothetical protein